MGRVVVKCLRQLDPKLKVTVADRREPSSLPRGVRFAKVNLMHHAGLVKLLRRHSVVINSTSHHFNLPVMCAALAAKIHYLDLGGLFHYTRKQLKFHDAFRKKGLTAVLGMGCAPGVANVLAAWGARKFDQLDEIHIKVGSRSWAPPSDAIPYAVGTIREELTWLPAVYEGKRWIFKPAMSGKESFPFPAPVGKQPIFRTIHSEVATLPRSFPGVKSCSFKIGFPDVMIDAVLHPRRHRYTAHGSAGPAARDIETTVALLRGRVGKKKRALLACCEVKSKGDHGSGDWDTAWPPAIVARMIARGEIRERGVFPPEKVVPIDAFIATLRKKAGFRVFQVKAR